MKNEEFQYIDYSKYSTLNLDLPQSKICVFRVIRA